MFCSKCGKELIASANFCQNCGDDIKNFREKILISSVMPQKAVVNKKQGIIVIRILKMFGVTILLIAIWYYIVRIFSTFGDNAKALGGLASFGIIIYLWIRGYKSIFRNE